MEQSSSVNSTQIKNGFQLQRAKFQQQPPSSIRKSNFFTFIITLLDKQDFPIEILKADFVGFVQKIDKENIVPETQNGMHYRLSLQLRNGIQYEENLYLRMVDSVDRKPIIFEGQDRNPELCRVLLTHESICSRCSNNKSCGNRRETPCEPIVHNRYFMRFFLRCNQNCLRNAGNPRNIRRFQLALSVSVEMIHLLAVSDNMFVHNNSKHTRGEKPEESETLKSVFTKTPSISAVEPSEGWIKGGTEVIILGDNFFDGLQVLFGNYCVSAEIITENALKVIAPAQHHPGSVSVHLLYGMYCYNSVGQYNYLTSLPTNFDNELFRLLKLFPHIARNRRNLSKQELLLQVLDSSIELLHSHPGVLFTQHPPILTDSGIIHNPGSVQHAQNYRSNLFQYIDYSSNANPGPSTHQNYGESSTSGGNIINLPNNQYDSNGAYLYQR